ncbi:MAG TPA: MerR family transcriptional regulator [Candidatus Aquabacterium excrementipullorum]|nr:MerR family transcriptional regulator [Candidatus Aquabacterium excrementipullorum]
MPSQAPSPSSKKPAAGAKAATKPGAAVSRRKPASAPDSGSGMTVAELARQTGVSVRNIRAYQTAGLMPPPVLHGRLGLYSGQHKSRLELIREMRHMGFGLEAIGDLLARVPDRAGAEYSLIAQLFSNGFFRVEQPLRKSLADLTEHWGESITAEQVMPLLNTGLYETVDVDQESPLKADTQVDILSPSLWAIGKQMAEMKVPLSTSLALQNQLIEHMRAIAQAYVDQFVVAMVRELMQSLSPQQDDADAGADKDPLQALPPNALRTVHNLFERLRPLAIGSVSAAFPVVLQQEFDRGVHDKLKARVRQQREKLSSGSPLNDWAD